MSKRAVIYARKSAEGQKVATLEQQLERGEVWCQDKGHTIIDTLADTYTGTELERPEMDKLRQMVKDGLVDVVVIWKYDRLSRNDMDAGFLMYEFDKAGVTVESVSEPSIDNSDEGRLLRGIASWHADRERKAILQRTSDGRRARVARGLPLPGRSPLYGYKWRADKGVYEVNPDTAPIVVKIFNWAAEGVAIRQICRRLKDEGILSPLGAALWSVTSVMHLIDNPAYYGKAAAMRWKTDTTHDRKKGKDGHTLKKPRRTLTKGTPLPAGAVPALVSEELAMKAQEMRQARGGNHRRIHPMRLLEGFVFCGDDGYRCRVNYVRGRPYYACIFSHGTPGRKCANTKSATQLDEQVWEDVVKQLDDISPLINHKERIYEAAKQEAEQWQEYMTKLQDEQRRLVDAYARTDDAMMQAMLRNRVAEIRSELEGTHDTKGVEATRNEKFAAMERAAEDRMKARRAIISAAGKVGSASVTVGEVEHIGKQLYEYERTQPGLTFEEKRIVLALVGCRVEIRRREGERGVGITVSLNPGIASERTLPEGSTIQFIGPHDDEKTDDKVTPKLSSVRG
jgi:site-specific DNA recombinase